MVLLVAYDLKMPGRKYAALRVEIKRNARAWSHYLDSTWIVVTEQTPEQLYERLRPHIDSNDRLLIIELPKAAQRQGWLPEKAWDWMARHLDK